MVGIAYVLDQHFNIGMLYGNLDEAYELVSSVGITDKIINAYLEAPQKGFNTQLNG